MERKLRRNDIVFKDGGGYYSPYGRVVRRIDEDTVEVIDCYKDITIYLDSELTLTTDYKGMWITSGNGTSVERFVRMPTLRKLKQMRTAMLARLARYDKWKKNR